MQRAQRVDVAGKRYFVRGPRRRQAGAPFSGWTPFSFGYRSPVGTAGCAVFSVVTFVKKQILPASP